MKRLLKVSSVVILVLAASGAIEAQSDPRNGTWKLNVAKSKFDPGPPRKSETRTYESSGEGYKLNVERVNGDGSKQAYGFSAKYDGKDYPITGPGPGGADTISVKRVDANTADSTLKKGNKALFTTRSVVSKDSRTLTLTSKGTEANGQPLNIVAVYDKQ